MQVGIIYETRTIICEPCSLSLLVSRKRWRPGEGPVESCSGDDGPPFVKLSTKKVQKLGELEVYNLEARPTIAVSTFVASGSVRSKIHQEIATKLISEIKGTNPRYSEDDKSTHMAFVKEEFPVPKPAQERAQETTEEEEVDESELFKR